MSKKQKHIEYWPNGKKKTERNDMDGLRDYKLTDWYENGQKRQKLIYKFKDADPDLIKGKVKTWYKNGQKKSVYGHYLIQGLEEIMDKATFWYANGQKKYEGYMDNSYRVGKWTFWFRNGMKKKEGVHKAGLPNGKWTFYNKDGSVKEIIEY